MNEQSFSRNLHLPPDKSPTRPVLKKIAEAMGVTIKYLLDSTKDYPLQPNPTDPIQGSPQ